VRIAIDRIDLHVRVALLHWIVARPVGNEQEPVAPEALHLALEIRGELCARALCPEEAACVPARAARSGSPPISSPDLVDVRQYRSSAG